jgi:hypothetical protein
MNLDGNRSLIAAALARIPAGESAALQTVYRLTSAKPENKKTLPG